MPTQTRSHLAVSGDYLADLRAALTRRITLDGEILARNGENSDDRIGAMRTLHADLDLLEQVEHAHENHAGGPVELSSDDPGAFVFALEEMIRLLADRLDAEKLFGPMDMGRMIDLSERLNWAAQAAIGVDPRFDEAVA